MWWSLLVTLCFFCTNIINAFAETPSNDSSAGGNTTLEKPKRLDMIQPDDFMHNHLHWGDFQLTDSNHTAIYTLYYICYGHCDKRKNISYWNIARQIDEKAIALEYIEVFNVWCVSHQARMLQNLFDEGYIHIRYGNCLNISYDSPLMIQASIKRDNERWQSPAHSDKMRLMLEIVAFSQVYTSWHRFPMKPVDPNGKQLLQDCFFELVYRLHALDIILKSYAYVYVERLAPDLAIRFRRILTIIKEEWANHRGNNWYTKAQKQCLVVSMTLYEWLLRHAGKLKRNQCAHDAFKKYLNEKEHLILAKVNKYRTG